MSRSGYSDDCEGSELNLWRGAVESAIRGKRGQAFLKELITGLDAMPVKELISGDLEANGQYCALGVVGKARGLDMSSIDPENYLQVAKVFGIARSLAQEIEFENDESWEPDETPSARWGWMRAWAIRNLKVQP